jgi:hypothetical protein
MMKRMFQTSSGIKQATFKDGFNQGRTKGASRTLSIMADWSSAGRRGPGRRFEET